MYACAHKPGADFSRGCALSVIRPAFLLTHPHRLTDRETTPVMASSSKDEQGRGHTSCSVRSIGYMRLRHKLVHVVVVAVVYAVDVS
jgi:hypothetical protein